MEGLNRISAGGCDQLFAGCHLFQEKLLGVMVGICRACVWEPSARHFSYIVLRLLQTVNATKDARPIVAQGQLRGGGGVAHWGDGRPERRALV